MTDHPDPFAPIDVSDSTDPPEFRELTPEDSVVVTPVPASAEKIGEAAARLFGRRPDDFWQDHDEHGRPLFAVARWNQPGKRKRILPLSWVRHPDGREDWAFKNHPAPRRLYRLNVLGVSPAAPVVVVEGEKCADAAQDVFPGSVVTTSPGGADAADMTDWKPLARRSEALIWPDADQPGIAYAEQVGSILHRLGVPKIRIVDALALGARKPDSGTREPVSGWDVADALEEGWAVDALRDAASENARVWTPQAPTTEWPDDFEMTKDGLVKIEQTTDGIETILFTGPFTVHGEGRDFSGASRGLWISWKDGDDCEQRGFVRHADLVGEGVDWLKDITDRGFRGPIVRKRVVWLRLALHGCRPGRGRIRVVFRRPLPENRRRVHSSLHRKAALRRAGKKCCTAASPRRSGPKTFQVRSVVMIAAAHV
jgi:putative DNA primase/helicase